MAFQVRLLGRFTLRAAGGAEIALAARKGQALVAILALADGEPVARERLAALLWSDRAEAQARSSLRQVLTGLRRAFGGAEPAPLRIDAAQVALDPAAVAVDALRFQSLTESERADDLAAAAALYRGELLAGLQVRDAAFEDWLAAERRRLQRLFEETLGRLLALQEAAGADQAALAAAERLAGADPLNEAAQRALMRLYAKAGERTRALAQYELCRAALARELGVEPETQTETLREQITTGAQAAVLGAEKDGPSAENPSLAVLPFANQSGDPAQDFVGIGLAEDFATELGRFRQILVIDHESSATFRGRKVPAAEIGRTLGAQYLLSGSIRRSERRAQVTTRLIEAASGRQLWAERYEVATGDLFALQQEVAGQIVATVAGRIEEARRTRARRLSNDELAAYDYVVQARQFRDSGVEAEVLDARGLVEAALALDPDSAVAHAELALTYIFELQSDWAEDPEPAGHRAMELAQKAVALDELDGCARFALGTAYFYAGKDFERSRRQYDKALELNPNDYEAYCLKSWLVACEGRSEEAMACAATGLRLNPLAPAGCLYSRGLAAYLAHRYEDAIADLSQVADFHFSVLAFLAASHALLGQADKARAARDEGHRQAREAMADYPGNEAEKWRAYWARLFPFRHAADSRHLLDGLARAGWTAEPARPAVDRPAVTVLPFANLGGDPEQG